MLRVFIGVPLPVAYQEGLEMIRRSWSRRFSSKMSWTRPGNWHLTLKFLGDAAPETVEKVKESMAGLRVTRFALQAGGGGFFPPVGERFAPRPRVVWVGLAQGASECRALAQEVEGAMRALGFPAEARPFAPHLTLARIKQAQEDPWLDFLKELQRVAWPAVTVDRVTLWRSVLGPGGPSYTPLFERVAES